MLIHGVGGGTCQWAAQMAKILGYKVIGTVAEGKADVGRATGCDELITIKEAPGTSYEDYTSVDVVAKVRSRPTRPGSAAPPAPRRADDGDRKERGLLYYPAISRPHDATAPRHYDPTTLLRR
jgi:hypothetical protein